MVGDGRFGVAGGVAMAVMHGGTDALGAAPWDFSTNSNAAGPCPEVVALLREVDATRYPDPTYTDLRAQLAQWHGVTAERIVIGASASELIARLTATVAAACPQARVWLPEQHYGDYATQAAVYGVQHTDQLAQAQLVWLCAPSSPLGQDMAQPTGWEALPVQSQVVLDCAYAPLHLEEGMLAAWLARDRVWQLWTPNKALGLCGLRAAYAIAPKGVDVAPVVQRASSWPVGAHGVKLLQAWCTDTVQQWVQQSRAILREWKAQQLAVLQQLGWECQPSVANFMVCRWPSQYEVPTTLTKLRAQGVKVRDCTSFGLPGWVRVCVHTPAAQQALAQAWRRVIP